MLLRGRDGVATRQESCGSEGIPLEVLKKYDIFTEVPLQTPGGYMKADIVLIKRGEKRIEDVIVIENKLSQTTDFTTRQKEGWKKIANGEEMKVKYSINENGLTLNANEVLKIEKDKVFKFADHGKAELDNTTISNISVDNFK